MGAHSSSGGDGAVSIGPPISRSPPARGAAHPRDAARRGTPSVRGRATWDWGVFPGVSDSAASNLYPNVVGAVVPLGRNGKHIPLIIADRTGATVGATDATRTVCLQPDQFIS